MKWYMDLGNQGDIVLSTRVRLARNLVDLRYAYTDGGLKEILSIIIKKLKRKVL